MVERQQEAGGGDLAGSETNLRGARQRKQVLLRLDPAVHAALAKWASDDLRSLNAQIEVLLRRSLDEAGRGVRAAALPRRGRPSTARADLQAEKIKY